MAVRRMARGFHSGQIDFLNKAQPKKEFNPSQYTAEDHSLIPYLFQYKYYTDNIGYVLYEQKTNSLIAFDTGHFEASRSTVERLEDATKSKLKYIFTTHKHADHQGANLQWKELRGDSVEIVTGKLGKDTIEGASRWLGDLDTWTIGDLAFCCMDTPGHTNDHVSFVVTHVTPESTKTPFLFCGDTMFVGGCGRVFDGTYEQLFYSLQRLVNLPHETLLWCSHEYTMANLKFAAAVEPHNSAIQMKADTCQELLDKGQFTVGSRMLEERLYNPFIRCAKEPHFSDITGEKDPVNIFTKIRKLKDEFKTS